MSSRSNSARAAKIPKTSLPEAVAEAKYIAEEWKAIYNHEWPHGSLNGMTPKRYWENWTQENQLALA
jgi:putative transposase